MEPARPWVVYVGRITRQKGLPYLLRAGAELARRGPLVLLAGAHPTPRRSRPRWQGPVNELRAQRGAGWSGGRDAAEAEVVPVLSPRLGLRLPFGLRADGHRQPRGDGLRDGGGGDRHGQHARGGRRRRARGARCRSSGRCRQRQSAATRTGSSPTSAPPSTGVLADPKRAAAIGLAGRRGAVEHFSWDAIAAQTLELYRSLRA